MSRHIRYAPAKKSTTCVAVCITSPVPAAYTPPAKLMKVKIAAPSHHLERRVMRKPTSSRTYAPDESKFLRERCSASRNWLKTEPPAQPAHYWKERLDLAFEKLRQ